METIKNYLENMFSGLPKTDEMTKLKTDIYENMSDKYQELKAEGKSENEAIGIVISEFGNIEELLEGFDIARDENKTYKNVVKEELPEVTMDTARNYLATMKTVGKFVGLGVLLCILGVAIFIVSTILLSNAQADTGGEFGVAIGVVVMLIFVAGGVALFIYSGILASPYEYIEKPFNMSTYVKQQLETEWGAVKSSNMVTLIAGICMCIISPSPVIISSYVFGEGDIVAVGTCIMLAIVACAVYLIIYSGCVMSGYHQLLEIGDYTQAKKKSNKIVEVVASIVWPLVTLAYLYMGFVHGMWHPSWAIFPIVGILFGIFSAAVEGISK